MDRVTVYPGAIPLETDLLRGERNAMVGMAGLASALFGAIQTANGLACAPTSPGSMQVKVGPGEIYSLQNLDNTPFSSLAADTAHQIVKQGISLDPVLLNCPAPTTAGYSVCYLIEAAFTEVDTDPVVLPYYNASDPTSAYSGPANSGTAQPTARRGTITLTAKPGVAAATGSQTIPAPDAGYVGLWVVTVAYGATSISTGNIAQLPGASVVPPGGIVAALQAGAYVFAAAGGTANALTAALTPAPASLVAGLTVTLIPSATNTGAATLNLNGLGAKSVIANGIGVAAGMLKSGQAALLTYDGTNWQLLTPAIASQTSGNSGYVQLASGLIINWGNAAHTDGSGAQPVTFAKAFGVGVLASVASNNAGGAPTAFHGTGAHTTTGMTVYSAASSGVAAGSGTAFRYIAIGI